MVFKTLVQQILLHSVEQGNFNAARDEWKLDDIYDKAGETCICGKHPITKVCLLVNTKTGHRLKVGNCCVNLFAPEMKSSALFRGVLLMRGGKPPNKIFLRFLFDQKQVSEREYAFLLDIKGKRKLTVRQMAWRDDIIARVCREVLK